MMFLRCVAAELVKLRRAKVTWVLGAIYCIAPVMMGLMMAVIKNPELGKNLGLFTAKAQLTIGAADWQTWFMLTTFLFAGGMVVISFAAAWVFGREYTDGTAKIMLALPVNRLAMVAAKVVVVWLWYGLMSLVLYGLSMAMGFALDIPGFSAQGMADHAARAATLVGMVMLVGPMGGWIAIATRGMLAPAGLGILFMLMGDLFSHTGWGEWVPWSIVFINAGASPDHTSTGPLSVVVLAVFAIATTLAAWQSLERTDNAQ